MASRPELLSAPGPEIASMADEAETEPGFTSTKEVGNPYKRRGLERIEAPANETELLPRPPARTGFRSVFQMKN